MSRKKTQPKKTVTPEQKLKKKKIQKLKKKKSL